MRVTTWIGIISFCGLLGHPQAARINSIDVPSVALEGDEMKLRCNYITEGNASLYSLKWYKDQQEFYRHPSGTSDQESPNRCPNAQTYQVDGVDVDCSVSTEREVVLHGVTKMSSGEYKCEIIGVPPKYRKEEQRARLTVFSESLRPPIVAGLRESYSEGEEVTLNCSSTNTEYVPELSWTINGTTAREPWIIRYSDHRTLGLSLRARSDLFQNGVINVSCQASFGSLHKKSAKVSLNSSDYLSTQGYLSKAGWSAGISPSSVLLQLLCLFVVVFVLASN